MTSVLSLMTFIGIISSSEKLLSRYIKKKGKTKYFTGNFSFSLLQSALSGQLSSDMQQKFEQIGVVEETFDEKEVKSGALESCARILSCV